MFFCLSEKERKGFFFLSRDGSNFSSDEVSMEQVAQQKGVWINCITVSELIVHEEKSAGGFNHQRSNSLRRKSFQVSRGERPSVEATCIFPTLKIMRKRPSHGWDDQKCSNEEDDQVLLSSFLQCWRLDLHRFQACTFAFGSLYIYIYMCCRVKILSKIWPFLSQTSGQGWVQDLSKTFFACVSQFYSVLGVIYLKSQIVCRGCKMVFWEVVGVSKKAFRKKCFFVLSFLLEKAKEKKVKTWKNEIKKKRFLGGCEDLFLLRWHF